VSPLIDLAGGIPTLWVVLALFLVAVGAGLMGSLLGLGGGIVLVPVLVLVFGVEIHIAIATSLLAVTANSCGAASTFVEEGVTSLRIGMFLESTTAIGGLLGAVVAVTVLAQHGSVLAIAFVPFVVLSVLLVAWNRETGTRPDAEPDRLSRRLRLEGEYVSLATGERVPYRVTRSGTGLVMTGISGFFAGLIGVGGGGLNVPVMNTLMNIPLRPAAATSTFMIGVTASAGAFIFFLAGDVYLFLAAPVAVGSVLGGFAGSLVQHRTPAVQLRLLLLIVLLFASVAMAARALGYLG
jgi:uncharacterized membrane protein YfcA